MPSTAPSRPPRRTTQLTADIQLGSVSFSVPLHTRRLDLGPGVTIQYYWIDTSILQVPRTRRASVSGIFANVLAHQWEAMRLQGGVDKSQLRTLLLAACYPLISADKAVQKIYRDACLRPGRVDPQEMSLPDDIRDRITRVVVCRDRELLRAELDGLLGPPTLSGPEAAAMGTACDGILDEGVRLTRGEGLQGMVTFVGKMDAWLQQCRRRGGNVFRRKLINHLAYQCKVAFYLCYANLWVTLIPWLKEHQGLDEVSERFLRVWHMQNQPVKLPDGRYLPDVICGQVLALHPLSGFFMKDPALCAAASRFFTSDAYDRVVALGRAEACAEYWEMVGAILTAAHLYRQAARQQEERRGCRDKRGGEDFAVAPSAGGLSPRGLLEELAARWGWGCASCGGGLRFICFQRAEGADTAELEFACHSCGTPTRREVGHDELRDWLK